MRYSLSDNNQLPVFSPGALLLPNILLIFLITLLIFTFSNKAEAMSCHKPENGIKAYPVVFKGTVISTTTLEEKLTAEQQKELDESDMDEATIALWMGKPQVTKFKVLEAYKGDLGAEVNIYHRSTGSVFGSAYDKGEAYVIYSRKDEMGRYTHSTSCVPGGKLDKINKGDMYSAQLEIFSHQAEVFRKLVTAEPENTHFYLAQATFHESYSDYFAAEKAYRNGLKASYSGYTSNPLGSIVTSAPTTTKHWRGVPFFAGLGRALFMQEKYEESLEPLSNVSDTESRRLYKTALIKLKRFDELVTLDLDLSGIEAKTLDLSGVSLDKLNLSDAKIDNLILNQTTLTEANFSNAVINSQGIKKSVIKNANFKGAKLSSEKIEATDFSGSNFSGSQLNIHHIDGSDFSNTEFSTAAFTIYHVITNTTLKNANLEGAYIQRLSGVDIQGAKLDHLNRDAKGGYPVEWQGTDLSGVDLSYSDLRGASLNGAKLKGTNLEGANLLWSHGTLTDFRNADLSGAKLNNAAIMLGLYNCRTKFPDGFSPEAHFMIGEWVGCSGKRPALSFKGLNLPLNDIKTWGDMPDMKGIDLSDAVFAGAVIPKFVCRECNLQRVDFSGLDLQSLVLENSDLRGANFSGCTFSHPILRGIKYDSTTIWPAGFDPEKAGAKRLR